MPRAKDLHEELAKVQEQMAENPQALWPIIARFRTPIYLQLVEDAIESGSPPLAHHFVSVVEQYFELKQSAGLGLTKTQQDTIRALAKFWNTDSPSALRMLLDKLGDPELMKTLLRQDLERQQKQLK